LADIRDNIVSFGIQELMKVSSKSPALLCEDSFLDKLAKAVKADLRQKYDYPLSQDEMETTLLGSNRDAVAKQLVEKGISAMSDGDKMNGIMAFIQAAQLDPELVKDNSFVSRLSAFQLQPLQIDNPEVFPK